MTGWKRGEVYRRRARAEGYRSRAAYKLLEIEKRFGVLRGARRVVDLCCAPGSWLQVVAKTCPHCRIVGVDMAYVAPLKGVEIIRSAIDKPSLASQILETLRGPADVVLSDCSPKLTGTKTLDRERQRWLVQVSLEIATQVLRQDGRFVAKVLQSEWTQDLLSQVRSYFDYVRLFKPKASFKGSPEMYLVARGFHGSTATSPSGDDS